jgi:rhodanese-related sulfurtransferase
MLIMKNLLWLALLLSGLACTRNASAQKKIGPDEFEKMIKTDKTVQLIDVRTPEEYAAGHLEGARNFDYYASDFGQKLSKLDKNKPVLVYCAVGGRSGSAAEQLNNMGFNNVVDLQGGIRAWTAKAKKVVQ